MSNTERDALIGETYIELRAKERLLACLLWKRQRLIESIDKAHKEIMPAEAVYRSAEELTHVPTSEERFELVSEINATKARIDMLKSSLDEMS